MQKITLPCIPTFPNYRWKELVDRVEYVSRTPDTTNYKLDICKEIYKEFIPENSTTSYKKSEVVELILNNIYDTMMFYKFPPLIDLLYLESFLLFGYKYGVRTIARSLMQLIDFITNVKQDELLIKISRNINLDSEDKLFSWDFSKQTNEIAFLLWSMKHQDLFTYCVIQVNSMMSSGSFMVKKGLRTVDDFNEVIGHRVGSLSKFLSYKFANGNSVYNTKLRSLVEQNFIVNEEVVSVNNTR